MTKTKAEKILSIETEIQQLENKRKQLIQEQKVQERKARTHRLCKRGGLWESLVPGTIALTDEQFKTFLEKTITTEYARRILAGLTAQNAITATVQGANTAERSNPATAAKPTGTAAQGSVAPTTETPQREGAYCDLPHQQFHVR